MASENVSKQLRMYKMITWIGAGFLMIIVFGFLFGWLVQFLWNATVAPMFDVATITFWQAFGLFILAKLFFGFGGGTGSSSSSGGGRRRRSTESNASGDAGDDTPQFDDEAFTRFWQEEGRDAYEAFRAAKEGD